MQRLRDFFNRRAFRTSLRSFLRYVFGKRGQRRVTGWRVLYRLRTELLLQTLAPITGNSTAPRTRLWVDKEVFPRIRKLLGRAEHTVYIQMFIWKDDALGRQMAELLTELADRGVKVQISKEATGDVFEFHQDFLTTKESTDPLWDRFWKHKNIRISYGKKADHAKVYVIDGKILLLTGMNIASEYHERLHDYMVELHGTGFVEEYLSSGEIHAPKGKTRLVMNSDAHKDIRPAVMDLLERAEHSIVVEQCYISDPKVIDLLVQKSKEKVRVTLIVPQRTDMQHHYANMVTVDRLLQEGNREYVQVYLYPRMFHGKTLLVDREYAFIGSVNLITSSLDDMGELNVLLQGRTDDSIQKLRDTLREMVLQSKPLATPPRLGWFGKWLGWLKL